MIDDAVLSYMRDISLREVPVIAANRAETARGEQAHLQIDPEQGQLMALLLRMIGARHGIEIGVFAGYSSLWLAGALPEDGQLLALDNDAEITQRAAADWRTAGLADRIALQIAPALESLEAAIVAGGAGAYDFVFIDADKSGYIDYYERALTLLRAGGLVMADNTLWYGRVADADDNSVDTRAIRAFNSHLHGDKRIDLSLIPIGDGLTVARKR